MKRLIVEAEAIGGLSISRYDYPLPTLLLFALKNSLNCEVKVYGVLLRPSPKHYSCSQILLTEHKSQSQTQVVVKNRHSDEGKEKFSLTDHKQFESCDVGFFSVLLKTRLFLLLPL